MRVVEKFPASIKLDKRLDSVSKIAVGVESLLPTKESMGTEMEVRAMTVNKVLCHTASMRRLSTTRVPRNTTLLMEICMAMAVVFRTASCSSGPSVVPSRFVMVMLVLNVRMGEDCLVGTAVGTAVEGLKLGVAVGITVGIGDGWMVGTSEGVMVGISEGACEGT